MKRNENNYRADLNMSSEQVASALNANLPSSVNFTGICTDSRAVKKGDIFFAIKGQKFDGHDYIDEAMHAGASMCVYEEGSNRPDGIGVKSVIKALGDLARYYRKNLKCKVVGITGSNGKTTTKNITYSLLSVLGRSSRSMESFNNNIGLPLSILNAGSDTDYLILELGMNHPGEIRQLAEICEPDIGIITNVGPVHLEFLGDIDSVASAKFEIFEAMDEASMAVINLDDDKIKELSRSLEMKKFAFSFNDDGADLFARSEKTDDESIKLEFRYKGKSFNCVLPLGGGHNAANCAAAVSTALLCGATADDVTEGLARVEPEDKRFERIDLGNIKLINDCYNANPASVRAAFNNLNDLPGKKFLIFGDMLELGKDSAKYHQQIGSEAGFFDAIFLLGEMAENFAAGAKRTISEKKIKIYEDHESLSGAMIELLEGFKDKVTILIKGSRGMHMEKVSKDIIGRFRRKTDI